MGKKTKLVKNNKKTICLNMIVKDESHVILECLNNLYKYIDYWVICDTGSTDGTQEMIKNFFITKNIPGELVSHEWKHFGYNRTLGLAAAYKKSDYVFIMDADDIVVGNLVFPEVMVADAYNVTFGSEFTYKRWAILNNNLVWKYKGVLHEYVYCDNKQNLSIINLGDCCYIDSRRLGNRNKDPKKYLKDAELLAKAIESKEDPDLTSRYCFYAGQSYKDYNDSEKSIKYYKKRIEFGGWVEELYISYMEIGNAMVKLKYPTTEIVTTFLNGFKTMPQRVECLFYLANYYFINDMFEDSYKIITIASKIKYPKECVLFVYRSFYDYSVKELQFKILAKIELNQIPIKNITTDTILTEIKFVSNFLLTNNIVPNDVKKRIAKALTLPANEPDLEGYDYYQSKDIQGFDISYLEKKTIKELKEYCDKYNNCLGFNTYGYIKSFIPTKENFVYLDNNNYNYDGLYVKKNKMSPILKFSEKLDFYNKKKIDEITDNLKNKIDNDKKITLTITSCKRLDLFKRTINSFVNCCIDVNLIDEFICIDDNSSDQDRETMNELYPFFKFVFKTEKQRGHCESMNMIIDIVKTEYLLHLEDDWLFCYRYDYITKALEILNQDTIIQLDEIPLDQNINDKKIAQVLFNKNYIEINDKQAFGGYLCETTDKLKYVIHEYYDKKDDKYMNAISKYLGPTCIYWPHYSFRPSIIKTEIFNKIGKYNKNVNFFEMDYAYRYVQNNYISCFFNMNPSKHIGKLTFQTNEQNANAYFLNNVNQFNTNNNSIENANSNTNLKENNYIFEDYDFYPNLDSFGNDLFKIDTNDINELKQNADILNDCVAFNTYGYLKNKIVANNDFIKLQNYYYKPDGLYVKKNTTLSNENDNKINKINNENIICVNLERRPDRKKSMEEILKFNNINNYKFYEAVDGNKLEPTYELYNLFRNNDFNNRRGVMGCALSHYELWKQLADSNDEYYLIMEDDVLLSPNFKHKLNLIIKNITENIEKYDIVFLGYTMFKNNSQKYKDYYYDMNTDNIIIDKLNTNLYIGGFFSYIITKTGAISMLKYIKDNGIKYGIDYLIHLNNDIKRYETVPFLVFTDWVDSVNSKVDSNIQLDFNTLDFSNFILDTLNINSNYNWTFYKGVDFSNNDLLYLKDKTIEELFHIAENNDKCNGFNTLGFFKHGVDSNNLIETPFINKGNNEGIYIKTLKPTKIIRVKMLCNWTDSYTLCNEWNNLTKGNYRWNDISLTWNDNNIDYYVIINKPIDNNQYYDPKKTIIFQMEPWVYDETKGWGVKTWGEWSVPDDSKFLHVRTHKKYYNNCAWQLKATWTELKNNPIIKDNLLDYKISTICSSKYFDPGHIKRIDFIKYIESKEKINPNVIIDIYGYDNSQNFKNYKGALSFNNKDVGITPYKYYFMAENNQEHNFITEKIWEPLLTESLCFYWGCPNLSDYINPLAYVQLDLNDFESSYNIIKDAINNNLWEERLPIIRAEKQKVLDYYGFCPTLERIILEDIKKNIIQ
jgi:GR25 family glycosyltransferase involved in LPS biosynthesis